MTGAADLSLFPPFHPSLPLSLSPSQHASLPPLSPSRSLKQMPPPKPPLFLYSPQSSHKKHEYKMN